VINVDTVYQKVLAILNKEQRGYLTPQKFNLYANNVQLDILEQYFYDLEAFLAIPGNSTVHADMVDLLQTKIGKFEEYGDVTFLSPNFITPSDCYRISSVVYKDKEATSVSRKDLIYILQSPIAKPSENYPIYVENNVGVRIYGDTVLDGTAATNIELQYIKIPTKVVWAYEEVFGVAQYNANASTHFELDPSEETDVVMRILRLAGIEVKQLDVYEIARGEAAIEEQQELR